MNLRHTGGKPFLQKVRSEIAYGHGRPGRFHELVEADFEIARRENVVRMPGEAELDAEELVDPKRGARGHAGKMRVHMVDAFFLQS